MRMTRLLAPASITLLAALVSACQTPGTASPEVASVHVPTVTQTIMTLDMGVQPGGGFSTAEIDRLNQWLDSVDVRYGDRISVDGPTGAGTEARRATIASILSTRGLMLSRFAPPTVPAIAAGMERVVIVRSVASVPECPDHRRKSNPEYVGSKTSNYGCAYSQNLAAMIADPNDLVSGKPHAGVTAERAVKAVEAALAKATRDSVTSSVGSVE